MKREKAEEENGEVAAAATVQKVSSVSVDDENIRALRLYLINILQSHTTGDSNNYKNLLFEIRHLFTHSKSEESKSQRQKLIALLAALSGCVSEIHPQYHSSLCEEFINVQFCDYVKEIQELLLSIYLNIMLMNCTTAWGFMCSMAISMVPFKTICLAQDAYQQWTAPPQMVELQTMILDAIEKVAFLKPQISNQFLSVLVLKAPHAMRSCESHCLYITALLKIIKRPLGANITEKIWKTMIQHLTFVDSNISTDDIIRESEVDNELDESSTMFECDMEQDHSDKNGKISDQIQQRPDVLRILVSLDAMMELIFMELEDLLERNEFDRIWRVMMVVFDSLLVTTHQAQFTHFLIFYLTQQRPEALVESFIPFCFEKIENEWLGPGLRSSYASYIVSLLARAKFAPIEVKLNCLECLLRTSEKHAKDHPEYKKRKNKMHFLDDDRQELETNLVAKHEVFFACIQGSMYLLCYLLPQLYSNGLEDEEIREKVKDIIQKRISSLLYHWLNPLNRTALAVAVHFSNLVYKLGIMDCRNLIYTSELSHSKERLQAFFPFDPYCLNRSSRFLNLSETYMTWKEASSIIFNQSEDIAPMGDQDEEMSEASYGDDESLPANTPQNHFEFGTSVDSNAC
eukprot:g2658.t1